MRRAWFTSLLFGALAFSGSFACGSSEEPQGPGSSSSSGGEDDGGAVDLEDIDLAVYPLRQYTGFDGAHTFQVPFSVFRAKEDLTVEASDPSAVDIVPASYDAAKEDGRYFLITAKKPGTITLTAKSRGKSVSSTLTILEYAAERYDAGQTRYENADGDQRACASCHQKSGGADHSPAAISAAADEAVKAVIRTGIDLSNSPIRQVEHRWSVEGATLDGLVTYLRALPPRGYTPMAQSARRGRGSLRHVRLQGALPTHDYVQSTRNTLLANPSWVRGLDPKRGLILRSERTSSSGHRARFAQVERGVPVLDAELSAHFDARGALKTLDSTLVADLGALDLTASIDAAAAERVAIAAFVRRFGADAARVRLGFEAWGEAERTPRLGIHTRHGARRLVYAIGLASEIGGRPLRVRARVDAHDGTLVEIYDDAKSVTAYSNGVFGAERNIEVEPNGSSFQMIDTTRGGGIYTYTAEEGLDLPGPLMTSTSKDGAWDQSAPNGKGSAVDAHFFAAVVYDFFKTRFERRGIDGKDAPIRSTVHYGLRYDNAFWEGRQMAYGDGELFGPFAAALDVVAHELTHGITQAESDLEYAFQSGAINESISDIFGAMVEHSITEKEVENWLIGEKIQRTEGTPLRSMIDPSKAEVPQPFHMEEYLDLTLDQDNGGVHLNSGIVNHAAYLMTVGGTHRLSKVEVRGGIGWEKSASLWYHVNAEYLLRQSDFADCAQATLDAAEALGFTTEERDTIDCAWKAVGVLEGVCGGTAITPNRGDSDDAGAIATGSSSSGSVRPRGAGAENADFDSTASACAAGFGDTSAPWAAGLTGLALIARARRRRAS